MQPLALFGPIDAILEPIIEYVLLVLVLVNMGTRNLAFRSNVKQAQEGGADALSRYPLHELSTLLLVLASFYLMTVEHHAGMITSVLALGLFLTDFFEFESRVVEARQDWSLDSPKAAVAASFLLLLYVAFLSVFFIIKPYWNAII